MIMTMTIDNWLEVELIRGINNQNLQKRLLQEKDPMLKDLVCIATQWQSAEAAMAQFIINNKPSENLVESKQSIHVFITYGYILQHHPPLYLECYHCTSI